MNLPVFHFQNSGAYLVLVWCCAFRPKTVASPLCLNSCWKHGTGATFSAAGPQRAFA